MASAPIPANDVRDPLVNLELESGVIGQMMCENGMVDRIADTVSREDFAEPLFQRLFDVIVHLVAQGKPANPATLRAQFLDDPDLAELGGPSFLARLTGDLSVYLIGGESGPRYLRELAERRRMREGLQEAARTCGDLETATSEIVTLADAAVAAKAVGMIRETTAAHCLAEFMDSLDTPIEGVTCQQIPSFDELHGPMEASQLVVLAARPGMGKTALALSYALGAARQGHGVLFVSLEMNAQQLAGRMAADLCHGPQAVPYAAIRDRHLNDFQRRRVAEAASFARGLPFSVVDTGSLTPSRLAMIARRQDRRFRAKGAKLDLIVVDYLQLMRPDSRTTKPYEAVSEVSRDLKGLAKDMGVPVLALAQLSREVEKRSDKRPQLSDLRDSGQIEQDADSVMFLLRPEYYLRLAEPDETDPKHVDWSNAINRVAGQIEFILAKRRNGTTGSAFGTFYGAYQAVR